MHHLSPIEKQFGTLSRYQVYLFFWIFIYKIPLVWHLLSLIFLTPPMVYYCNSTAALSESLENAQDYCPCSNPVWDRSVFTKTAQTKFGFYCDFKWLTSFSQSLFYVGTLIGSLLFGFLSDSNIFVTWHLMSLLFLSPPMKFYCDTTELEEGELSTDIENRCPCPEPYWDKTVFTETMQTKFLIYCENIWLISLSQSMFSLGLLVGALIFGFLADRYGRLSMFSISTLTLAVFGCLVSLMPTASTFILMRCIEGIGVGGAIVTSYVLLIEYCGVRHRETVTALYHIPINIGHASLAGLSYMLRDCDEFQLAMSIPTFLLVIIRWLIMESPKWLMDNDNVDEAASVMQKFCRFNRSACDGIKEELAAYHLLHSGKPGQTKMKFRKIFKNKKLTINFVCMAFIYFVCGSGFYGVSQFIGKMSGDIHANVAISACILLPGTITSVFLLKIFGRRTLLMSTHFLSGIFMISVVCVPYEKVWARMTLACISNTFFFMSFIIVFLYGVELFPTTIRNSVLGVLSVLSRAGQIIAPPINSLSEFGSGVVFGVLAIIGGALCYPLPETKNTELPSSVEDTATLPRKKIELEEDIDNTDVGTSRI